MIVPNRHAPLSLSGEARKQTPRGDVGKHCRADLTETEPNQIARECALRRVVCTPLQLVCVRSCLGERRRTNTLIGEPSSTSPSSSSPIIGRSSRAHRRHQRNQRHVYKCCALRVVFVRRVRRRRFSLVARQSVFPLKTLSKSVRKHVEPLPERSPHHSGQSTIVWRPDEAPELRIPSRRHRKKRERTDEVSSWSGLLERLVLVSPFRVLCVFLVAEDDDGLKVD